MIYLDCLDDIKIVIFFLHDLNGAQELFIENPFILDDKHIVLENLRGNLNILPSFRLHFLDLFVILQQDFIKLDIY